jgi:arabinan endo-1,5-alpha-L-arabinosidase
LNPLPAAKAKKPLQIGDWWHIATTIDANSLRLYVNGAEVAATTATHGSFALRGSLWLVMSTNNGIFDGAVDEVAVFDRILSEEEVRAVYQWGRQGRSLSKAPYGLKP